MAKRMDDLKESGHERTRELRDSHRLVALGTAAAKIMHDLANPLKAISTSVQLIERSLAENSDREALTELVQGLKEENARVQALIEELRQFARPLELKLKAVNLAELLSGIVREAGLISNGSHSVELEQSAIEDLPVVWRIVRNSAECS